MADDATAAARTEEPIDEGWIFSCHDDCDIISVKIADNGEPHLYDDRELRRASRS